MTDAVDTNEVDETMEEAVVEAAPRIGIFGGTFNPFHAGHLNSIVQVAQDRKLAKVVVVPTYQNPTKQPTDGPTPAQRLEMARLGVQGFEDTIEVSSVEFDRGGVSYTIDTLKTLAPTFQDHTPALIVGLDAFFSFDRWKDPAAILEMADLIVTSRPGYNFPTSMEEMPSRVRDLVEEFGFSQMQMKTGRKIEFVHLKDVEVSATEIRKRARAGYPISKFLPPEVEHYILDNKVYGTLEKRINDFENFARHCVQVLFDKKGVNVKAFDLRDTNGFTDFNIIASGTSTRHASSLGESLMKEIKEEFGVYPLSLEGVQEGRWVLLDYGALVVHIFYDYVRQEYRLEELWKAGKDMNLVDSALSKTKQV